jgi:hypothetical protein
MSGWGKPWVFFLQGLKIFMQQAESIKRKMVKRKLLLVFFHLACSSPSLAEAIIDKLERDEIAKIAKEIIEYCPPSECTVIAVGRSPTPIVAYLQALDASHAINLPLSNFRYAPPGEFQSSSMFFSNPLDEKSLQRLMDYFERQIPKHVFNGQKRILVLDFALGGASLVSSYEHLRYFSKIKGHNVTIKAAAMLDHLTTRLPVVPWPNVKEFILPHNLSNSLLSQRYDKYAEFKAFQFLRQETPERNKSYSQLMKKLDNGASPQQLGTHNQKPASSLARCVALFSQIHRIIFR